MAKLHGENYASRIFQEGVSLRVIRDLLGGLKRFIGSLKEIYWEADGDLLGSCRRFVGRHKVVYWEAEVDLFIERLKEIYWEAEGGLLGG